MKFKTDKIEKEWSTLKERNRLLFEIAQDIDNYSQKQFGIECIITSIKRTMQDQIIIYGYEKPSVHLYWRGIDFRNWIYNKEQIQQLTDYINEKYEYDPKRPDKYKVAINHDVGKGNHLHVQSHPNTIVKKKI